MKIILRVPPPELNWTEKKALAKKTGQAVSTIYRILAGDITATDKFLKSLWGKEKYKVWISRLQESANSITLKK